MSGRADRRLAALAERVRPAARPRRRRCGALLELLASTRPRRRRITDPGTAVDAHVADALVALELDAGARARAGSPTSARAPAFPGSSLAAALPDARGLARRGQHEEVRVPRRAPSRTMGLAQRRGRRRRARRSGGRDRRAATSSRRARSRRSTSSSSTRRRCSPTAGRSSRGRDAATRRRSATAAPRPPRPASARRASRPVRPWDGAEHLHLHLYLKVGTTPNRYPRRPGMASKRPLRAST